MISIRSLIICGLLASSLSFATHAQERSAGGTTETQMTWSALKNLVETANIYSKAAHDRIDKIEDCTKKGLFYSAGHKEADTQGCVAGLTSCPANYTLIGNPGTSQAVCMSTKLKSPKKWADAFKDCHAQKANLCTTEELLMSCFAGAPSTNKDPNKSYLTQTAHGDSNRWGGMWASGGITPVRNDGGMRNIPASIIMMQGWEGGPNSCGYMPNAVPNTSFIAVYRCCIR